MFARTLDDTESVRDDNSRWKNILESSEFMALICPADVDIRILDEADTKENPNVLIDDHSYFYLGGYYITNDSEMQAFADVYRSAIENGRSFDRDLEVAKGEGTWGGDFIIRRQNTFGYLVVMQSTPPPSPIAIERLDNHKNGANVLYSDGHVEWVPYPGKWPMTETTVKILQSLDTLGEPTADENGQDRR